MRWARIYLSSSQHGDCLPNRDACASLGLWWFQDLNVKLQACSQDLDLSLCFCCPGTSKCGGCFCFWLCVLFQTLHLSIYAWKWIEITPVQIQRHTYHICLCITPPPPQMHMHKRLKDEYQASSLKVVIYYSGLTTTQDRVTHWICSYPFFLHFWSNMDISSHHMGIIITSSHHITSSALCGVALPL